MGPRASVDSLETSTVTRIVKLPALRHSSRGQNIKNSAMVIWQQKLLVGDELSTAGGPTGFAYVR